MVWLQCFGGKSKNTPGLFDRGPDVISAFALNDLYDQDFGIRDLDLLETVGKKHFSCSIW